MSSPLTRDDPERVGEYWPAAGLGAGGQGVVYEAYDASGTRYALKTLHAGADPFARGPVREGGRGGPPRGRLLHRPDRPRRRRR
ncbi:hypothetical protein AB8B12_14445 [Streptomyces sp. PGLac3x]